MHILHKWKKDSKNTRTCTKCGKHQYYVDYKWIDTSCKVHQQMVLYDLGKDMAEKEKFKCEYHTQEIKNG